MYIIVSLHNFLAMSEVVMIPSISGIRVFEVLVILDFSFHVWIHCFNFNSLDGRSLYR